MIALLLLLALNILFYYLILNFCFVNFFFLVVASGKGTGMFAWVNGPSPGSEHDLAMFRYYGLENSLCFGEFLLCDKGYQGHEICIVPYRGHGYKNYHHNCDKCNFNYKLSVQRIIVERSFSRLKIFRCLSTRWRHALNLHPVVFYFIAELCNVINKYNPLFA